MKQNKHKKCGESFLGDALPNVIGSVDYRNLFPFKDSETNF